MIIQNLKIKICLLGEPCVGKTSLVYRYITSKFRENYKSTLGVNLLKKDIELTDSILITVQLWDLGGQDSFKSLRNIYFEGADGALILYDVTDEKSFYKLEEWINSFREINENDLPTLIIGNKIDLKNEIKVSEKQAKSIAKAHGMNLILTSAKNGNNVEMVFMTLIKKIYKNKFKNKYVE